MREILTDTGAAIKDFIDRRAERCRRRIKTVLSKDLVREVPGRRHDGPLWRKALPHVIGESFGPPHVPRIKGKLSSAAPGIAGDHCQLIRDLFPGDTVCRWFAGRDFDNAIRGHNQFVVNLANRKILDPIQQQVQHGRQLQVGQ